MRPARAPIEDLRLAIDRLPLRAREAMLAGIRSNDAIVAARTHVGFAHAWDRFAGARAGARQLRVLEEHLRASILAERCSADLGEAIAEHQALVRDRKAHEAERVGLDWTRERELA
jgi:hypothetical protein